MVLEILNAKKVADNGLLSKIQIGGKNYEVKDVIARESIESLSADLAAISYVKKDGIFESDTKIKEYVDAQVGSINKFDVVIDTAGLDGKPNTEASADTMYKLYLVQNESSSAGEYIEYITIRSGEEGAYTYAWEAIGSTKMSLTGYVTESALRKALEPYEKKENLKDLAYKDSASGTVAGQTISGVKASGQSAGSINVALEATENTIASAGKYTPAGNVTGTVEPSGSVAVTVSTSAADATLTKGDYTPAGTVTVSLSGNSFNAITGVGTQASFTEGVFTPAALNHAEVTANYVEEGLVGAVEDETLTFTAAAVKALSASKVNSFSGGSKAADTFIANSLPTMAVQTVGVKSASFTGALAEDLVVTNVSYAKANAEAAATFTGDINDIAATFAGAEGDISVSGNCHDYSVKTAEFVPAAIELSVGDIVVAEKNVTVS